MKHRMEAISTYVRENRGLVFGLFLVLLVGIVLRVYEFHDWLRFSGDQARDAAIIGNAVEKGEALPLLGPAAGGTEFFLGPLHYYLSLVPASFFGSAPDTIAYPSLLLSILTIPLLFFFLREYFGKYVALSLTALSAVSYIMVNAGRFSSNQNLVPFFVLLFLYGLLRIINDPKRFHPGWSVLVGIGLGAGIQTHTFCLVVMPLVALIAFLFLIKKRAVGLWRSFAIVVIITLGLNVTQIVFEWQTDFQNTAAFFQGAERDSDSGPAENFLSLLACQVEANAHFIASLYDDNDCKDSLDFSEERWEKASAWLLAFASLSFSLFGYVFLARRFRQEGKPERKHFLGLIIVFHALTFLFMVSVARYVHVVYFLVIFFVPFVLLGILLEVLEGKWGENGKRVGFALLALFLLCSFGRDLIMAKNYAQGLQDNEDNSTLAQVENMSEYILTRVPEGTHTIYFSGGRDLNKRFSEPIEYFINRAGLEMESVTTVSEASLEPEIPLFFITDDPEKIRQPIGGSVSGHEILAKKEFFNQTILVLQN